MAQNPPKIRLTLIIQQIPLRSAILLQQPHKQHVAKEHTAMSAGDQRADWNVPQSQAPQRWPKHRPPRDRKHTLSSTDRLNVEHLMHLPTSAKFESKISRLLHLLHKTKDSLEMAQTLQIACLLALVGCVILQCKDAVQGCD